MTGTRSMAVEAEEPEEAEKVQEFIRRLDRRRRANAAIVIACVAAVSMILELKAGWAWDEIFQSFMLLMFVLIATCVRFRNGKNKDEHLWITWLWRKLLVKVEGLLPELGEREGGAASTDSTKKGVTTGI